MRKQHVYIEWKNHVGGGAFQIVRIDSESLVHNRNKAFSSSDISNSPLNSIQLQQKHSPSPMAYVERGVVKSKRSIWRLKTITDFFWAIVNIIGVFFATMFSMEKSDAYRKGSAGKKWDGGAPGGPGGGGGGGGGPYGGGPRGPPRGGLDNVRGIDSIRGRDHSSLPACGSCCG